MLVTTIPTLPASPGLAAQREAWDNWRYPFLAGLAQEIALDARGVQTRELASLILAAPLRTTVADMTLVSGGWSRERGDFADAAGEPGSMAWTAALGVHEDATLTADARSAITDAWCKLRCDGSEMVRYERWSARGQEAHGYVCSQCRRITQTG
jgi:hypothetical protein